MRAEKNPPCKIAILASGNGTNAQALIDRFTSGLIAEIVLIASDIASANVLKRAQKANIKHAFLPKDLRSSGEKLNALLEENKTQLIVLAGYLKLVPEATVQKFAGRIVNVHPALLPNYGGKGMYGMRVHKAVIDQKEPQSGITIHLVNEQYDKGEILRQERLNIENNWDAQRLAQEIHKLEHRAFPEEVEKLCLEINVGLR